MEKHRSFCSISLGYFGIAIHGSIGHNTFASGHLCHSIERHPADQVRKPADFNSVGVLETETLTGMLGDTGVEIVGESTEIVLRMWPIIDTISQISQRA